MQRGRTTAISIACTVLLGAGLLGGSASGKPASDPPQAPRAFPDQTARIASVRVYQGGAWVLPGENSRSVGRALASLKPTWVGDLIRFAKNEPLTGAEVRAWSTIKDMVTAAAPDAQFGIELNALEYRNAGEVERMMSKIRTRFDNDGWMMDFYTSAYKRSPDVVEAAIAEAHDNGEWIGGNAFGLANNPKVPPGSDFMAVQDFNFKIDLPAVKRLAKQVPVAYHLGNTPQLANSDGCQWIRELDTARRIAFLKHRAQQQATFGFHMSYPVFFPECQRHRGQSDQELIAYNAIRDAPMLRAIGSLMNRFGG